jgi:hypothetical protein
MKEIGIEESDFLYQVSNQLISLASRELERIIIFPPTLVPLSLVSNQLISLASRE